MLAAISIMAGLLFGPGLEVRSESDCPSSEAITSKLFPLLPQGNENGEIARVTVAAQALDGVTPLYLRLMRSDGGVILDRHLLLQGSCDDMADTVATVLATWRAPMSPPPSPQNPAVVAGPAIRAEAPGMELWVGAGAGLGLVRGMAPLGSLELLAGRPSSSLRARLAAVTQASRQQSLSSGDVTWRRLHGQMGLGWQSWAAESGWQASLDVAVLLGWLTASGQRFAGNSREDAMEYGLAAGLRGQRRLGAWALWLDARTTAWAQGQRAVLSGSPPASLLLPRFDVLVTLGASRQAIR